MGLGRREARHETVGSARTAGVDPTIYWEFKPGQRVMTTDGFPGKVVAVNDGPFAGNEEYEVTLDNGLGGGRYTSSLLRPLTQAEANHEKTAADDYPELQNILVDRPPLELSVVGSKTAGVLTSTCKTCDGRIEAKSEGSTWKHADPDADHAAVSVHDGGRTAGNKFHESDGGAHEKTTERCVKHLMDDGHDEESAIRICKDRHKKKSMRVEAGPPGFRNKPLVPAEKVHHDSGYQVGLAGHSAGDEPYDQAAHKAWQDGASKSFAQGLVKGVRERLQSTGGNDGLKYGTCAKCGDTNVRVTKQSPVNGDSSKEEWRGVGGDCSCTKTARVGDGNEYFESEQTDLGKAPAQAGEGDYTNDFDCPSCGGSRALRGVDTLKCENCGYMGKTAAGEQVKHPYAKDVGATCKDCGFSHTNATPGQECILCGGQMSRHPEKFAPTALLVLAAIDPSFRFHITATFADVRNKAKRLRAQGNVNIIAASDGIIAGNVKGDHAVYETTLTRSPGKMQSIAQWSCGCKWASYSWGRSGAFKRFEGRLCSHALALQFEAQARGMFGQRVTEDKTTPDWLRPRTRVVVQYDKDTRKNVSRPAQPRQRDLQRTYAAVQTEQAPADLIFAEAAQSYDLDEIVLAFRTAGIEGRSAAINTDPEPPKSHHRDRSSDLTPCANGGCGHPEGIHGEEGGDCNSPGCECKHYSGPGKQASLDAEAKSKKKNKHHEHHRKNHRKEQHSRTHRYPGGTATPRSIQHGGYGAWWHGIGGYGIGYCGYAGCSTHNGYSGDGVLSDGGGGGDSGGGGGDGGGSTASRHTADNQANQSGVPNGFWPATRKRLPSENPGSAGFAATGDPENWKGVGTNSISDRMASLASLSDEEWDEAGAQFLATHKEAVAPLLAPLIPMAAPAAGAAGRFLVQKVVQRAAPAAGRTLKNKVLPKVKDKIDDALNAGKSKSKGKGKVKDKDGDGKPSRGQRLKNKMKGRGGLPVIPLPGLANPDYQRPQDLMAATFQIKSLLAEPDALEADFQFEADLTPQQEFANDVADTYEALGGERLPRYAELNDEPEPALPQTDGESEDGDALGAHLFTGARMEEPGPIPVTEPDIDFANEEFDESMQVAASSESVDDIVAQFQATAGQKLLAGSALPGDESDVASAAKAFLAKESMKTFAPHEQKEIIDEGMDVKASNLDLLKIEGTHYEALEAALASMPDDDDLEL